MATVDIQALTRAEKVALMEDLWLDLSETTDVPPSWHAEELKSRENEWAERRTLAKDWQTAKNDLRRQLAP